VSVVVLASGGVDSALISVMAVEEGQRVFPLFVDYGQRAAAREWQACTRVNRSLGLPRPKRVRISGYGRLARSGLTDPEKDVLAEAFTPGRNGVLLWLAASYAYCVGARAVAIGLVHEQDSLFPDQSRAFLRSVQGAIREALGLDIVVTAPLIGISKRTVLRIAADRGISGTYSCHAGSSKPCGRCVSCREANVRPIRNGGRSNGGRLRRSG
jgi:7-cyano-7-deazaguanine synthase